MHARTQLVCYTLATEHYAPTQMMGKILYLTDKHELFPVNNKITMDSGLNQFGESFGPRRRNSIMNRTCVVTRENLRSLSASEKDLSNHTIGNSFRTTHTHNP